MPTSTDPTVIVAPEEPVPLTLDPLGVPPGYVSVDNGPISQPVVPAGDPNVTPQSRPVVAEEPETWPTSDDPLGETLLREDVVEETLEKIKRAFEQQYSQHISAAEWEEVQARLKKWL
jgi:hypothetical protein